MAQYKQGTNYKVNFMAITLRTITEKNKIASCFIWHLHVPIQSIPMSLPIYKVFLRITSGIMGGWQCVILGKSAWETSQNSSF